MTPTDLQSVLARVEREREASLAELFDFLRIPSVSTDPAYKDEVSRCADWLLARLRAAGLTAERVEAAGHPLLYAEWLGAPGKPTVLFYGHYDVQPPDPLELWRHPPFEPTIEATIEGDAVVARGSTDDKGQSYAQVKGVAAWLAEHGSLPVNVKFLIEGEEESGGESIDRYVRADRANGVDRLAADCVVISDSALLFPGQPAMPYGLRGIAYMEITVRGPERDLHSGTYGGAVVNPLNALCHIVAQLYDPASGRTLIPGFYDAVRPLEAWEREELRRLPFDEEAYRRDLGVRALGGEPEYTVIERTGARPSCDLNGIYGGYQGKGAKTVLPAWAGAKVSMRLVPDQEPKRIAELFRQHVLAVAPAGVAVEVEQLQGADPVLIEARGPLVESAMNAMAEVWGNRPLRTRDGGSIPIVATFSQVLRAPVILLGFGLPDDRLHSPNEKFAIEHFWKGIRSIAVLLARLAETDAGEAR